MFVLYVKEAKVELRKQEELDSVIEKLEDKGFVPILRTMLRSACHSVGIESDSLRVDSLISNSDNRFRRRLHLDEGPIGDIFHLDKHLVLLRPQGARLLLCEIRHHDSPSKLDDYLVHIENAIKSSIDGRRVRGMSFDWKETKTQPRRRSYRREGFSEVGMGTKEPEYTEAQIKQSKLLVTKKNRDFILNLAQLGKARTIDAATISDSAITQPLLVNHLILKEYLVTCRKDSRTLCSVPEKNHLNSDVGRQMHCPTCGRDFKDELIEEIFALTDASRTLIRGSQWMTIWVTDLLCSAGIPRDKVKWNAATGDDELDIVTEIQGMNVFFELKDREFGLGDAYPFGFRLERYGGDVGVVVTMDKVAKEAKKFFEEQADKRISRIECLDGEATIKDKLPNLIEDISRRAVERFFLEFTGELGLSLLPLVKKWLQKKR